MVFGYDVPVKFSIEGACKTASVHLSGYFQPGPDDDDEDDDEDGDDEGKPHSNAKWCKHSFTYPPPLIILANFMYNQI